ncbi:hypothetical protein [Parabacteroides sp.]
MSEYSIQRRRADLIKQINEIDDEELLISLEDQIFEYKEDRTSGIPIPEILRFPSKEKLHGMIEQVLEDDRNGRMIDGEEMFRQLEEELGIGQQ